MASSTVPPTAPAVVETTVAPAPTTATTEAPPTSASTTTITTVAVSQPPVLYSEADLRVVPEDADVLAAASRAEWFVSDYFTADSEENTAAAVLDALPPGTELPPMPHEEGSGITYVEWARAFRIETEGDGVYTVGVLFRSLVSPEGGAYYRIRMRAVEVTVVVGVDGGTTVLDLPAAVPVPDGPLAAPQRSDPIVPPGDVADRAVALALEWGSDPLVLGATLEEEGWRVVLTVADEIGSRWPVVVRVPVE